MGLHGVGDVRRVQQQLLSQVGTIADITADARALEQRIDELEAVTVGLEQQIEEAVEGVRFTPRTTVARALALHSGTRGVLAEYQLDKCDSCPVRHDETLEEVATGHAIPLESLLSRLQALLRPGPEG